jgi:hypothetical protein
MIEQLYHTGLVADGSDLPPIPIIGRGWRVEFRVTPESGRVRTAAPNGRVYVGREVILLAGSWATAQAALSLIACGIELEHGPVFGAVQERPVAHNAREPKDESERMLAASRHRGMGGIPGACKIAARASRRRVWAYALEKFALSLELFPLAHIETDPSHSGHIALSRWIGQQVRSAQALVVAYAAIEDLGLEVRASAVRPSRVKGEWNPEVRDDLIARLKRAGVDFDRAFPWMVRGPKTAVEAKRAAPSGSRPSWNYGVMVRDRRIPLIDALAQANWLRSRVAAHASNRLARSLSPYDVANVQMVARWLLMYVLRSNLVVGRGHATERYVRP